MSIKENYFKFLNANLVLSSHFGAWNICIFELLLLPQIKLENPVAHKKLGYLWSVKSNSWKYQKGSIILETLSNIFYGKDFFINSEIQKHYLCLFKEKRETNENTCSSLISSLDFCICIEMQSISVFLHKRKIFLIVKIQST